MEINPLRLKAIPNTKVCVNCSTTGTYRAEITTHGEGDHTWNDLQILTPEQHETYLRIEDNVKHIKGSSEYINWDYDDEDFHPSKINNNA
jgi:hypothetical protein